MSTRYVCKTELLRLHHAVSGFYAVLFAFVLPFVCWGAAATPGHPHGTPHLVFSMPQMSTDAHGPIEAATSVEATLRHLALQSWCSPFNTAPPADAAASDIPPSNTPTGQSTPSTLFVVLLLLAGTVILRVPLQRDFARKLVALAYREAVLPVPAPPPRLVS